MSWDVQALVNSLGWHEGAIALTGLVVAGLVLLVARLVFGRRPPQLASGPMPEFAITFTPVAVAQSPESMTPVIIMGSRSAPRRPGSGASVVLFDANGGGTPRAGRVLERSATGLRLILDEKVPVGTVLTLRPAVAPQGPARVHVEVRRCQRTGSEYELGCWFLQPSSWSTQMFFS
jgi:hypothetical protein